MQEGSEGSGGMEGARRAIADVIKEVVKRLKHLESGLLGDVAFRDYVASALFEIALLKGEYLNVDPREIMYVAFPGGDQMIAWLRNGVKISVLKNVAGTDYEIIVESIHSASCDCSCSA